MTFLKNFKIFFLKILARPEVRRGQVVQDDREVSGDEDRQPKLVLRPGPDQQRPCQRAGKLLLETML